MKKYIIPAVLLVPLLLVVGISMGSKADTTEASTSDSPLSLVSDTYNFGTIDIFGGKVATDFTIRNTGDDPVTILSAQTSCMCTTGIIDDLQFSMHETSGKEITVPAGDEKTLTAIYDPLAHGPSGTGKITRELVLKTNSSETPELRARFSADVVKNQ